MKIKATAESKKIGAAIRAHLEQTDISRREFERKLKRGKTTVDHLFIGQYSEKLLQAVEQTLGKSFRADADKAPPEWGGYTPLASGPPIKHLTSR